MKIENNFNNEDWEKLFKELLELNEEFIRIQNKRRNDFNYHTEFVANESRKKEIIYKSSQLIRNNIELNDFMFSKKNDDFKSEKERNDYKEHMEARGFLVESSYSSYISDILNYLEEKLN